MRCPCYDLTVEGIPVYGHKILCIRCNYFNAMLTGEVIGTIMSKPS
jgi:hypothetical protein